MAYTSSSADDFSIDVSPDETHPQGIGEPGTGMCSIRLRTHGVFFPHEAWRDKAVVIVAWWLEGLRRGIETQETCINRFMNGPYEFHSRVEGQSVHLRFLKRRIAGVEEVLAPNTVSITTFADALVSAAQTLLLSTGTDSEDDADVAELRMQMSEAQRFGTSNPDSAG